MVDRCSRGDKNPGARDGPPGNYPLRTLLRDPTKSILPLHGGRRNTEQRDTERMQMLHQRARECEARQVEAFLWRANAYLCLYHP